MKTSKFAPIGGYRLVSGAKCVWACPSCW